MRIQDFFKQFPDETSCKAHFKSERDKQGVKCKKCEHKEHYWLSTREQYQCKKCKHRTPLRSGTLLHGTHSFFCLIFISIHMFIRFYLVHCSTLKTNQFLLILETLLLKVSYSSNK